MADSSQPYKDDTGAGLYVANTSSIIEQKVEAMRAEYKAKLEQIDAEHKAKLEQIEEQGVRHLAEIRDNMRLDEIFLRGKLNDEDKQLFEEKFLFVMQRHYQQGVQEEVIIYSIFYAVASYSRSDITDGDVFSTILQNVKPYTYLPRVLQMLDAVGLLKSNLPAHKAKIKTVLQHPENMQALKHLPIEEQLEIYYHFNIEVNKDELIELLNASIKIATSENQRQAIALLTENTGKIGTGIITSRFAKISIEVACIQILSVILKPYLIDQDNTFLCGPAAVLYALAVNKPIELTKTLVRFLHSGSVTGTFNCLQSAANSESCAEAINIFGAFMTGMKRVRGVNYTGYIEHPMNPITTFFSGYQGVTGGNRMVKWLRQAGFDVLSEDINVGVSKCVRVLLGVQDSPLHTETEDSLTSINQEVHNILLLSPDFLEYKIKESKVAAYKSIFQKVEELTKFKDTAIIVEMLFKEERKRSILDRIDVPHYVYLRDMKQIEGNIHLGIFTWGKCYTIALTLEELRKNYFGRIAFKEEAPRIVSAAVPVYKL